MKLRHLAIALLLSSMALAQNQYAIGLDGSESFYVNDGDGNDLDVSSAWTFETWIKVGSYTSLAYDCIMDRRSVFSFYLVDDDDNDYALSFVARSSADAIIASMDCDGSGSTSANMEFGIWYHVAATYDGTTARLYVNGTEYDSDTDVDWLLTEATTAVNLGGRYWGSYSRQMSDAQIDEIRISNIARSLADMQTSNGATPYEVDANTVLLMHLDDQGDPPTYASGTGLDGSTGDTGITLVDYVDVSESLYLENRPPQLEAILPQWTDEHQAFEVFPEVLDPNGDDLTYDLELLTGFGDLVLTDSSIIFTPDADATWDGIGLISVSISDGELSDSIHFSFHDLAYADNLRGIHLDGSTSLGVNDDIGDHLDALSETWFMEAWIRIDSTSVPSAYESIMDRRTVFSWFLVQDVLAPAGDYALKFAVRSGDALGDTLSSAAHEQVAMFYGEWYHIAVGYDGSNASMWIGPYLVDSNSSGTWQLPQSTNALNIGARYWGGYSNYLHGDLDEIRLSTQVPDFPTNVVLNRFGAQYTSDELAVVLFHLDDLALVPSYISGQGLEGISLANNISTEDYIDLSLELPFDTSMDNQPPMIYPQAALNSSEAIPLEFWLYAFDETEIELTWSAISNLPDGAMFQQIGNNSRFNWTPDLNQAGSYDLTFQVSDGSSTSRIGLRTQDIHKH